MPQGLGILCQLLQTLRDGAVSFGVAFAHARTGLPP
jgi:hypothetical protein